MVTVYEVYLDVFFIDNMIANLFVLTSAKFLINGKILLKIKPARLILAAAAGALISTGILFFGLPYGIRYVLIIISEYLFMLEITGISYKSLPAGIIYMNMVSLIYSKLNECIVKVTGTYFSNAAAAVLLSVFITVIILQKQIKSKKTIYKVMLVSKGNTIELKALYDSGNFLKEPMSGTPVSIIERNAVLEKWQENTPEKYKIIPYKSVGNEHGILEGMVVEKLLIQKDNEQAVFEEAVIAFYDKKLSQDGSFQMILNHSLI